MSIEIELGLLEAYSRGEISRRDIQDCINEPVSFGDLLMQLHAHGLKLPRVASDPNSQGVRLIRQLAERGARVG